HDGVVEFFSSTNVSDRDGNMVKHMLTLPEPCDATSALCAPSAVRQQSNAGPTLPLVDLVGKSLRRLCSYTGLKDAWAVARLASLVLTPIHPCGSEAAGAWCLSKSIRTEGGARASVPSSLHVDAVIK